MKTTKRFAAIASGLALTAAGFVSPLSAQAAVSITIPDKEIYRVDSDVKFSVSGCTAGDNVYATLVTLDKELVDLAQEVAAADGSATLTLKAADISDDYEIWTGCGKYDMEDTDIAAKKRIHIDASEIAFFVDGRQLKVNDKFNQSTQPLTLSSSGFHAGDKITLAFYTPENKLVWSKEVGSADANGNFTGTVKLPTDLAEGKYILRLHDENGGGAAVRWKIDSVTNDKVTVSVTNAKPAAAKKPVVGLPKAGV